MSDDRGFERALDDWLADGSDRTPKAAVDAVLLAVGTTPQDRDLRIPWRTWRMPAPLRLAAGVAIVAVVGFAGLMFFNPGTAGPGGVASPTPTSTPTATPTPLPTPTSTPTASPTPVPTEDPLDTSAWTSYSSSQYGFTIAYPVDWGVDPADRAWTFEADAGFDPFSPAMDHFFTPFGGGVQVSAWAVAVDPGTAIPTWADLERWIEEYCQKTNNTPCTGIHDRAVPLCLERRDCHPGLLVPFRDDVQAFFTNGGPGQSVIVVAVWRQESDASVTRFGGSRRLLEAFLSTMCVWPEDARPPFGAPVPGC